MAETVVPMTAFFNFCNQKTDVSYLQKNLELWPGVNYMVVEADLPEECLLSSNAMGDIKSVDTSRESLVVTCTMHEVQMRS